MRPWIQAQTITRRGRTPQCPHCLNTIPVHRPFFPQGSSHRMACIADNLSRILWCAADREPINTAPNCFHRQAAPACSRALGERLRPFALNSLQHPFTNMVKCKPNPWPCLCEGTFFPSAKIANLNGFQLLHGWLPAQSACRVSWHIKGLLSGRCPVPAPPPPPYKRRSHLWTCGPTQWLSIASKGREMASFRCIGSPESCGAQVTGSLRRPAPESRARSIKAPVWAVQAGLRGLGDSENFFVCKSLKLLGTFRRQHIMRWKSCGHLGCTEKRSALDICGMKN